MTIVIATPNKGKIIKLLLQFGFVALLLVVFGLSLKLYFDSQDKIKKLQATVNSTAIDPQGELAKVVLAVGKHIVLPTEEPRLVTIDNVEILSKEQPFFLQASNGDKLLVYSQKVILYNPSSDRVVDIAQIRTAEGQAAGVTTQTTPPATVSASQTPTRALPSPTRGTNEPSPTQAIQ